MAAVTQSGQATAIPGLDGNLKSAGPAPTAQDPLSLTTRMAAQLESALASGDLEAATQLFDEEGYWKDQIGLHWNFKTVQGHAALLSFLKQNRQRAVTLSNLQIEKESAQMVGGIGNDKLALAFFQFQTDLGSGRGVFRLREDKKGVWKVSQMSTLSSHFSVMYAQSCRSVTDANSLHAATQIYALYTTLQELKGHPARMGAHRPQGVDHGQHVGRISWRKKREQEIEYKDRSPEVLIVGAGQAGLSISARLKMLGVDALMIDANDRIGDNWRKRYEFLVLHDPVWYDSLPILPFPSCHPVFTPKDKLADWFEFYASALELNNWMSTTIVPGSVNYDEAKKQWTVKVRRGKNGEERTLHPDHIVMATGHSGEPNIPKFPGAESFKGKIVHSSQHTTGGEFKGKKAIVVGCCNSGHDIAHDFYEQGADITIVQRSSTYVMSSDSINDILFKGLYCEGGPKTDDADLLFVSTPNAVHHEMHKAITAEIAEYDKELLDGLSKTNFKLDMGIEGSGFLMKYYRRGGGYYLDVGASQLIIDGKIKVKQGQQIDHFEPDGIVFADGDKRQADIVVLATGYLNMKTTARKIFGDKVADRLNDAWGVDQDGELGAMYRDSGHPRFYYMGGNLAHCRSYSLPLAIQIKAQQLGLY